MNVLYNFIYFVYNKFVPFKYIMPKRFCPIEQNSYNYFEYKLECLIILLHNICYFSYKLFGIPKFKESRGGELNNRLIRRVEVGKCLPRIDFNR